MVASGALSHFRLIGNYGVFFSGAVLMRFKRELSMFMFMRRQSFTVHLVRLFNYENLCLLTTNKFLK